MYFNCCLGQMFVSDVSDFLFVGKVEQYFLSAGEEVLRIPFLIFYCDTVVPKHETGCHKNISLTLKLIGLISLI